MIRAGEFMQDYEVFTSKNLIKDPKVSVIMPTYCRGDNGLLARAIDSVLSQSFADFELIIVDDGSVDRTRQVVEERMKQETRLVYIRNHVNSGLPAIKVMQGYFQSRAPYIAYQFDDDQWKPHALKVLYEGIRTESKDTFVYGACEYIRTREGTVFSLGDRDIDEDRLLYINSISNNAVMHHREIFNLYGAYDPSLLLRRATDWDMWKRWIGSGAKAKRIDSVISVVEEQHAGSLNMTVDKDIAIYKIFESFDLKKRNQALAPEHYADYPVDSSEYIVHPRMQTVLHYERIYPYYLSRIGKDPKVREYLEKVCILPNVLILLPLSRYKEIRLPLVGETETSKDYTFFYMAKEQLALDHRAIRFADVIITETAKDFAEREKHLLRQKPVIELEQIDPDERQIDYLIRLAIVRHEIRRIHIVPQKDTPADRALEEAVERITGQPPIYLDAFELCISNLLVDPERFRFEVKERLRKIGAEAILDLTGEKEFTRTLREISLPSPDIDEIRGRERIMPTDQALLQAFFHQILYIRALEEDRIDSVRKKEEIIISAQTELSCYRPQEWRERSSGAANSGNEKKDRAAPASYSKDMARQIAEQSLEIESLSAEIFRLKREHIMTLGYLTEEERKDLKAVAEQRVFGADLSDLCIEEEIAGDRKITFLRHISGDYYKKMCNYLDLLRYFPEDDRREEGYYLAKSPCLHQEAVIAYILKTEKKQIEKLELCFTNYNPAALLTAVELRITDSEDCLLRCVSLRGYQIRHREPTQIALRAVTIPDDGILKLFVFGSSTAASSGICIFEWKKRGLLGRTKDQKPLLRII